MVYNLVILIQLVILTLIFCVAIYTLLYRSAMRKVGLQIGLSPNPIIQGLVQINVWLALGAALLIGGMITVELIAGR